MARVRDVDISEVPQDVRGVYQRFASEYGPFINQVKVFAHRPTALKHLMGLLLELGEEQIVELTLRTALCGFFNRFNDAMQIAMEDGLGADEKQA